ncbi:DUF4377 domain-containing protein [Nocardia sp. NBC_01388]|uniref:DUF4377 domain-containing protein n=1 Tax=Nocardia sp. NBC_01388 TaxID=2903596 RepID=UPI00324E897B
MRTRLPLSALLALLAVLPLTACGSDNPDRPAATSAATTTDPGTEQFDLYVADRPVPCNGVAPHTCLQVSRTPNGPWELHYTGIAGFDYQPGFHYQLRIEQRPWHNPPADAPAFTWHLVKVIAKDPAQ